MPFIGAPLQLLHSSLLMSLSILGTHPMYLNFRVFVTRLSKVEVRLHRRKRWKQIEMKQDQLSPKLLFLETYFFSASTRTINHGAL